MFLVRSAFWLTVAFVALHPHDVDLGAQASALSNQALAAGQQLIAEQIVKNDCLLIRCVAAPPIATTASLPAPSASPAMQDQPTVQPGLPPDATGVDGLSQGLRHFPRRYSD